MTKNLITPEELRELLIYDPDTGKMFWRPRKPGFYGNDAAKEKAICIGWNKKYAGREAFVSVSTAGYLCSCIRDRRYKAHRVIWALHYGEWPSKALDHINRNTKDNRIANLREADPSESSANRRSKKDTITGLKGVLRIRGYNRWRSEISFRGKRYNLGYYRNPEEASRAYQEAAKRLHGEFACAKTGERP